MKITLEQDGLKTELTSDSVECSEILQEFCQLLMGQGFHPNSVRDAILTKAEEYEEISEFNS